MKQTKSLKILWGKQKKERQKRREEKREKENTLISADFSIKMKVEKKKKEGKNIKAVFTKRYLLNSFKVRFIVKSCLSRI